ncbi:MAG: HAD-IA family hydrolase [Smithella sp.]
MRKVDLMIFDFDGTLVSTGSDLITAVNHTLEKLGYEPRKGEEIISFIGDGVKELLQRSLGGNHLADYPEANKIFTKFYSEHLLDNAVLYPGVKEMLEYFKHKIKVILTNKRQNFTLDISRSLGLDKYFVEIIGDGSFPYRKPDHRLVDYLLDKYGVKKEKTVIIGDGLNDIALAKNSEIISCAFLKGLGNAEKLLAANPDYYCDNLYDITSIFS